MKKLGLVLALLGALFVIVLLVGWFVDSKARSLAEAEAEKRILEVVPGTHGVDVTIEGFPFLFEVFVAGQIDELHVVLSEVHSPGITVETIDLKVTQLKIDRDLLLDDQKLAILDIGHADVVGRITGEAASAALREKIVFDGDKVHVEQSGMKADAKVALEHRKIVITLVGGEGIPSSYLQYAPKYVVPLPPKDVLPCEPGVSIEHSRLQLRCSVDELPASVKKAIGQR